MAGLHPKSMFLIDGVGACVSAVCLGLVLPAVQAWVGMPSPLLYVLAAIAALFALNACAAYRLAGDHASRWLRLIMGANLLYCVLTASLVIWQRAALTGWGLAYFGGEIVIILGLVYAEGRALRGAGRSLT
jgi:hypothetical protein